MKGTVNRLIPDRGFGFVDTEDGHRVFFHRSHCDPGVFEQLSDGDVVDFEEDTAPSPKGPRAANVRRGASPEPQQ